MSRRTYTKRARAQQEAETRARILAAVLELWAEEGPAATTITAVAARAGVQRLTVYRHFGDDASLAKEASARFAEDRPVPDPADWAAVASPAKRLRRALRALYSHYRAAGPLLAHLVRDGPRVPALAGNVAARDAYLEVVVATLETGWRPRGKLGRLISPALEHAVRFETWQSLAGSDLDDREAARLMERMVRALTRKDGK